jgi:ribosomal protein L37AE/L43A
LAGAIFEGKWVEKLNHEGGVYWERPGAEHVEVIDPPNPCPKCNSLELWKNALGDWRCMICDPPATALRLLKQVEIIWAKKANHLNRTGF